MWHGFVDDRFREKHIIVGAMALFRQNKEDVVMSIGVEFRQLCFGARYYVMTMDIKVSEWTELTYG